MSPRSLLIITCVSLDPPVFQIRPGKRTGPLRIIHGRVTDDETGTTYIDLSDVHIGALTSRWTSMGAQIERVLAKRLVELDRLLADKPTPELWDEYYRAADLWLRVRAPAPSNPPITRAMLNERFKR